MIDDVIVDVGEGQGDASQGAPGAGRPLASLDLDRLMK
jgi:hypothetical protein